MARLVKVDGIIEDIELHSDQFFLDNLLESELGVSIDFIDFYYVRNHAIAYNTMALALGLSRNGVASQMADLTVYGDVVFIPRRYIRET